MSDSVASRERTMQSYYISIKKNWRYSIFSHTNRSDSSTESSELHKKSIRSNSQSLHRCMLAKAIRMFDALHTSCWFSIFRSSLIFLTSLTHLLNLLQRNYIDIEPMRPQCEMRDWKFLWNINDVVEWVTARVVNVSHCHSRLHDNFSDTKYLLHSVSLQSILNICCHMNATSHEETQSVFNYSIARFTNRSYVIFEVNRLLNFDSFVSAVFASMYDLILKSTALKDFARKFQTIHRWENSRDHFTEKVCSNDSHSFQ